VYAGARGYLDKVAEEEIGRFEFEWLAYANKNLKDVIDTINKEGQLSEATDAKIKAGIEAFSAANEFKAR